MDRQPFSEDQLDAILLLSDMYIRAADANANFKHANRIRIPFDFNNTDYAAGTDQHFVSPMKGDIVKLVTLVQVLTAGAGSVTIKKAGGSAIAALSQTIGSAAAVGTKQVTRTEPDVSANSQLGVDDDIVLGVDATPTAGALRGYIEIQPRA